MTFSSAGKISTARMSIMNPDSTSVRALPWVRRNAATYSSAAAGLYSSHAASQPTCLRHQDWPQSLMLAAAASGNVPVSATTGP